MNGEIYGKITKKAIVYCGFEASDPEVLTENFLTMCFCEESHYDFLKKKTFNLRHWAKFQKKAT